MVSLKVKNLSKSYISPLLEGIAISHTGKGIVALIGDNGSGKTTLLKILSDQEVQDSGEFNWNETGEIGFMPQELINDPSLSGGQKKIAYLSELIYSGRYDVLLLDEPDNHLDLDNKIWLEEALKAFDGLVIMISHDRTLLENVSTHVWLVEDNKIRTYPFGYKKFRQVYEQEQESLAKLYKMQLSEKKRLESLILIYRDKGFIGQMHNVEHRLSRHVADMVKDPKRLEAKISIQAKSAKKVIKKKTAILVDNLSFGYQDQVVFDSANLHLFVQDKVGLLSPNGTGKSTLVKLLLGHLQPSSGVAKIGDNLTVGYYSQEHLETLDPNSTPMQIFMERYPLFDYQVLDILRKFFFSKNSIKAKISTLSGGQKSRLQLALFLYKNPDVLILDEPTNHLDLKSIASLEKFLIDFQGTVLLVSHDRELVENVCDDTYLIKNKKFISV